MSNNIFNTNQNINQANIDQGDTTQQDSNLLSVRTGRIPNQNVALIRSHRSNIDNSDFFNNSPSIPVNNTLDITFPSTSTNLVITSTSTNDISITGTGARTLTINGLDSNYDLLLETVSLNGPNGVTTTNQFFRINELKIIEVGNLNINDGNIYVSDNLEVFNPDGTPQTKVFATLEKEWGVSNLGVHTVPRGFEYIPSNYFVNTDAVPSRLCIVKLYVKENGDSERLIFDQLFSGAVNYEIKALQNFNEKTDIRIISKTNGNYIVDKMNVWFQFLKKKIGSR